MKPFSPEEFLILIVDDIPQNLQVIGDILEGLGMKQPLPRVENRHWNG